VKNRPALRSVFRELLKSTKGAISPAARVKNSSAPQFVLRELLKSDCLPQQPAEKLEAKRTLRDSGIRDGHPGIVTIQPNGTKPPIFCISALDGDLTVFRTLSAGLGTISPCMVSTPPA